MRLFFALILLPLCFFGQEKEELPETQPIQKEEEPKEAPKTEEAPPEPKPPHKTPEEIQLELAKAEIQFVGS